MNLKEYIEERKADRNLFWKTDPGGAENLLDEAIAEITRLRCDAIRCDQGQDILTSLYAAMAQLPACGTNAILCAAAQEIDALRGIVTDWRALAENVQCNWPAGSEFMARLKERSLMATRQSDSSPVKPRDDADHAQV